MTATADPAHTNTMGAGGQVFLPGSPVPIPGNAAHGDQFIQVLRLFAFGCILTIVTSLPIIVTCHDWLAAPVKAHS